MPQYRFKAIDAAGKVVTGVSSAPDEDNLSGILQGQGLFLMESSEAEAAGAGVEAASPGQQAAASVPLKLPFRGKKVSPKSLSFLTSQLYIMVRSSLPLLESINLLAAQTVDPTLRETMRSVARGVSEGLPLSAAFSKHPDVFDEVYISLLAAGEMGGELDKMLERLAAYQAFRVKLAQSIRSALAYPLVVLSVTMIVVMFLLFFVLPTFMQIFVELNIPLPWTTRTLIFASDFVRGYWWALALAAVASWFWFKRWIKSPINARRAARLQLALPVIGPLTQNIVMTRTLRTMGSLVASGVSILKCLELSRSSSGNPIYADFLEKVAADVREGRTVSESFAQNKLIPPMVIGILSTGERTGQLPEVIARVAEFYESETETSIKNLFVVLEPAFILGLGLMVAGVAVSVLMPLFGMMQEIH